jgi:homeobox protein cut-like
VFQKCFPSLLSLRPEFKKIPDEEKLTAFKGLLKGAPLFHRIFTPQLTLGPAAYQTEIDNLTKRSKSSENAFLNVYKVIAEAPDPYPLLEAAVVSSIQCIIDVHTGSRHEM